MYDACNFKAVFLKNGYPDRIETSQPYNIAHRVSFEVSHNMRATFNFFEFLGRVLP